MGLDAVNARPRRALQGLHRWELIHPPRTVARPRRRRVRDLDLHPLVQRPPPPRGITSDAQDTIPADLETVHYVARDELPIGLDEYFILIGKLDCSTDSYKEQVKLIIADVARAQGTAEIVVNVVTDIEIALLESFPTTEEFYAEHGDDYVNNVVLPKEVTDWVAAYTGGFDFDTNELSDSDKTFEVIWFPGGDADIEKWKPVWD